MVQEHKKKKDTLQTTGEKKSFGDINLSQSEVKAIAFMRDFAQKKGYAHEFEVFEKGKDEARNFLISYVKEAVKHLDALDVARTIVRARYPAKIKNFVDVTSDQAASALIFAITSKVNWFDLLIGGPIIENGVLMNGRFGRSTSHYMNTTDLVAGNLYINNHCMGKDLPLAPCIMFGASCANGAEFASEAAKVVEERADFEKKMRNYSSGELHRFKLADAKHDGTMKFRVICTVFNRTTGELWVVSDKEGAKPTLYSDWVKGNLNDLLSASDTQIDRMRRFAGRKGGLLDQLRRPRNRDDTYQPWKTLLEEVKKSGGVTEGFKEPGDHYRQAVKIWRYAMLQLQAENSLDYQKSWEGMKLVDEVLHTYLKMACNDGRQSGDIKILGAIASHKDFKKLFEETNGQLRKLRLSIHGRCGFISASHDLHLLIRQLKGYIEMETDAREHARLLHFFGDAMNRIREDLTHSPVMDGPLVLRDYLRGDYKKDYDKYVRGLEAGADSFSQSRQDFVKALHGLFLAENKLYRSVISRALDAEVFRLDENSFIDNPSAAYMHDKLRELYGDGYAYRFSHKYINELVIEEVGRQALERYQKWAKELKLTFGIELMFDTIDTGQTLVVPPRPVTKEDFENHVRKDLILQNFTKEELKMAGVEKFVEYRMAA